MRKMTDTQTSILEGDVRQYRYRLEIWDVLTSGAPTIAQIVNGSAAAASATFSAFYLDATQFVGQSLRLDEPGDKRAAHLTFTLLDIKGQFNPDGGTATATFVQNNQVVRLVEGDEALASASWIATFTGHIRGQAGFTTDREGIQFQASVAAYGRRATPRYLKQSFTSQTYGKQVDLGRIAIDVARQQMGLGDNELSRVPIALGRGTQFAANSIVDLTPLEAIDKILEVVGHASDFDGDGRLRYYSRDVTRGADKHYDTLQLIGSVTIPQAEIEAFNSVKLLGLDKQITLVEQPAQALARATIPVGFWRPTHEVEVLWSEDRSLRAKNATLAVLTSVNQSLLFELGTERFTVIDEFSGRISVDITSYVAGLLAMIGATLAAKALIPDVLNIFAVLTIPVGRVIEAALMAEIYLALATVSSGQYEVRGNALLPVYRELSVIVTADGVPDYLLNQKEIRNDWFNEVTEMTTVAQLELIFEDAQAKPREFSVHNDLELEIGDIVYLPIGGGLRIWIESFSKEIARGMVPMMRVAGYKCP